MREQKIFEIRKEIINSQPSFKISQNRTAPAKTLENLVTELLHASRGASDILFQVVQALGNPYDAGSWNFLIAGIEFGKKN